MRILVARLLLLYICCIALFSCSDPAKQKPALFSRDMLQRQYFELEPNKNVAFKTLHGSVISVPAGAFNVSEIVKLEIREAFTPAEILAAGLVTESNGRPLKSGGMIYVNATANDQPVELLKPIDISIPNNYYDSSMQVFKGVETDSGIINWVDPLPTDTTPQSQLWTFGKVIFQSKCASCHSIFRDMTGPALKDVENRGPWTDRRNLYQYIRNASKWAFTNPYVKSLKAQFGSIMTAYPALSDTAIDAILLYINTEAKNPSSNEIQIPIAAVSDSSGSYSEPMPSKPCKDDTTYLPIPEQEETMLEDNTSSVVNTLTDITEEMNSPLKASTIEGSLRSGFTDRISTFGMYDFSIKTLGWYNIDAAVEGYDGTSIVNVTAELKGEYEAGRISTVYLFCPGNRSLSVSNHFDGNKYSYNKINNGIPLFIGDRAILFAFGSKGDKAYYGISEFKVSFQQTIPVTIFESTDEEIRNALHSKQMDGIDLGIEKKEMRIIKPPCNDTARSEINNTQADSMDSINVNVDSEN